MESRVNHAMYFLLAGLVTFCLHIGCIDSDFDLASDFPEFIEHEDVIQKPSLRDMPGEVVPSVEEPATEKSKQPPDIMRALVGIVPLPDQIKNFLRGISITFVKEDEAPKSFKSGSTITVNVNVYGVSIEAYFIKATTRAGKKGTAFIMTVPREWKLSDMIPGFTNFDALRIAKPTFVVSDFEYQDEERSVNILPGFNVIGSIGLRQLKLPTIIGQALTTLSQKIAWVQVHGLIRKQFENSTFGLHIPRSAIVDQRFSIRDFFSITQVPLPDKAMTILDSLAIANAELTLYIDRDVFDFTLKGKTDIYGSQTDAELSLYENKKTKQVARNFTVQLPPGWRFKDDFPALAPHFDIAFDNGLFVLSDHVYKDIERDVLIQEGLNFIATIDFSKLVLPSFFDKVAPLIGKAFSKLTVLGVLKKELEQSRLLAYVPEEAMNSLPVRLSDFLSFAPLKIPERVESILRNIVLEFPRIALSLDPNEQRIVLDSSITMYGTTLPVRLMILKGEDEKINTSFTVQLPRKWSLTKNFPEFKGRLSQDPRFPRFIISTMNYHDPVLNIMVKRGLNFIGAISIDDIPTNPITKEVKKISGIFKDLLIHIAIPERIPDSTMRLALMRLDDKIITLNDLFNVDSLSMPRSIAGVLKNLRLISPEISFVISPDIRTLISIAEFQLQAGAGYKGQTVRTRFLAQKNDPHYDSGNSDTALPNISFEVELPYDWTFKENFDDAEYLDRFSIDNPRFVLSNFNYRHPDFQELKIFRGLNFIAGVKLDGPLDGVRNFVDKILGSVVSINADGVFLFNGTIGTSLIDSTFSVYIPASLTVDFDALYAKKVMPFKMPFVKKIATDTFSASIAGRKGMTRLGPASLSLETGMRIFMRSQEDPLVLRAGTSIEATQSSLYGFMDTPYDPAFGIYWLELDEFGIELVFDYNLLQAAIAATGTPAPSGVGFRGAMRLGKKEPRAVLALAAKVALSSAAIPDLIFHGKAERINLTHLIWLLAKIAKKDIALKDIPIFEFEHVEACIVPEDAKLAQKKYSAGMYASAWINLFGLYGGIDLSVTKWGIRGKGILPKIDTPWLKLSAVKHKQKELGGSALSPTTQNASPQESTDVQTSIKQLEEQPVGIDDFPPLEPKIAKTEPYKEKPHDGPSFQLDVTWFLQRAFLNGKVELPFLKVSKEVEAEISLSGIKVRTQEKWLGIYQTDFEILITKEDAYVKGRMQQSALRVFEDLLKDIAQQMVAAADQDIREAKATVTKAMGDLDALKKRVNQQKNKCGL